MAYQYGGAPQSYGQQPGRQNGVGYGGQQYQNAQYENAGPGMRNYGRRDQYGGGRGHSYEDGGRGGGGSRYDNRGGRPGLGADSGGGRNTERDRQQVRENMLASQPPTREEVARTIFVGGLGEDAPPDEVTESILRCAGKLRRWTRAKDASDKKCRFGFAEYEDVDSLETAKEVFGDGIEVPAFKDGKIVTTENGPEMIKLLVVIDEQSSKYIDEWMSKRQDNEAAKQFRVDGAREDLRQCMTSLASGNATNLNSFAANADMVMLDDHDGPGPGAIDQPDGSLDDDLADIPPEQRAVVAQEIKSFRDRANRRDQEHSELIDNDASRPNNHTSATNGTKASLTGAPAGPKGYRGAQLPSDYVNGVAFVSSNLPPEDESDASDTELEKRRQEAKREQTERQYLDAERRWLNRERQRLAAQERERVREDAEARDLERRREAAARKLSNLDDDEEDRLGREEFYRDRSAWARKRAAVRNGEARDDDMDRQREQRERNDERMREAEAMGAADRFLAENAADLAPRNNETGAGGGAATAASKFKISLGSSAAARKPATQPKRTIADVAGLLEEDEENADVSHQRELRTIPAADLQASNVNAGADMSEEERNAARQALAAEIPMDATSLFAWEVRWSYIGPELLDKEIRPFVEKKIVDILGVQEDFLVDLIITGLKDQKTPQELITDLEQVLDEEAEGLVRKTWRLVVYFGEAEGRGLV